MNEVQELIWTNISKNISTGTKDKTITAMECVVNDMTIVVHRHKYYEDDVWVLSCGELLISAQKLLSKELEEAKEEAVKVIYVRVLGKSIYYNKLKDELKEILES